MVIALVGIALVGAVLATFARTAVFAEVPDSGGAYVEGLAGFPQSLNPILANDEASHAVNALVFSGLTKLDDRGQAVPDLAESVDVSPDGRTYTFVIRANARWHDGHPVTADDAVFTFKTIQDAQYSGPLAANWRDVTVEKVDDRTVRLKLEKDSFAPFVEYTAVGLLPAHVLGDVGPKELAVHRFNVQPVGTGPFRVREVWADRILLERAKDYYGPTPYLNRIIFRIYPNHKTILTALERDEVEGAPVLDPADASRLANERQVALYSAPQASLTLLFFNLSHPPLADRTVRQALAYALDRQKLIDLARQGRGRKADSPVLAGSWAYNQDVPKYEFDAPKARTLLDQAGWKQESEGAIRVKDGVPLRFVLLTNDRQERLRLAEEIQRQLGAVGVDVEVQATGAGGLVQDFLLPRKFQLALYSWDLSGFDPDPYALWHSTQLGPRGYNVSGYTNRRVDDLLEKARRTSDRDERARLYAEFQTMFAEDLPSLPLYYPTYDFAISRKIKGVKPGMAASPADRFRNVVEWYAKTKREVVSRRS